MRKFFNLAVFVGILASTYLLSNMTYAQEEKRDIKLGILNVETVQRQSLLARDIDRQLDAIRRKFMGEIKEKENNLRKLDEELQKQRVILSPEAFAEEQKKFRVKNNELRKDVQIRNRDLSQIRSKAAQELQTQITKALTQVSNQYRYNLVFRYSPQLILVRPDYLDITKLVVDQLNKNIKKYNVSAAPAKTGK